MGGIWEVMKERVSQVRHFVRKVLQVKTPCLFNPRASQNTLSHSVGNNWSLTGVSVELLGV